MTHSNPSGTVREPFRNPENAKSLSPVPVPTPVPHPQRHLHRYQHQHLSSAQRARGVVAARGHLTAVEGELPTEISSQTNQAAIESAKPLPTKENA